MTRTIHGIEISGVDVDEETRCAHYHGRDDVVALKFKCCGCWFPCHLCHEEIAQHEADVWTEHEFDQPVVLCGACGHRMTAQKYLASGFLCPNCARSFNRGCASHVHYYFAVATES